MKMLESVKNLIKLTIESKETASTKFGSVNPYNSFVITCVCFALHPFSLFQCIGASYKNHIQISNTSHLLIYSY